MLLATKTQRLVISACAVVCFCFSITSQAAISFPKLTGQVVDGAGLLSNHAEKKLAQQLAAHDNATSNQVVVVTLKDLQGYSIEEYGYQLGREWGIGQKGKDNGVLLIIAKAERKVRIEVGYGLEGTLTDAISANIIHSVIRPAFKKRQFEQGINAGVSAIIEALGGQYTMKKAAKKRETSGLTWLFFAAIIFWPIITPFLPSSFLNQRIGGGRGRQGYGGYSGGFGGGSSGGGFGGGFGGGGGGFGGGGASGGW